MKKKILTVQGILLIPLLLVWGFIYYKTGNNFLTGMMIIWLAFLPLVAVKVIRRRKKFVGSYKHAGTRAGGVV